VLNIAGHAWERNVSSLGGEKQDVSGSTQPIVVLWGWYHHPATARRRKKHGEKTQEEEEKGRISRTILLALQNVRESGCDLLSIIGKRRKRKRLSAVAARRREGKCGEFSNVRLERKSIW